MSVRANAELFRQIPLLADCEDTHLQLLAFASERLSFPPGETVVRAGDQDRAGYLIVSGAAEVSLGEGTAKRVVATLGPGAFIGELAMIAGTSYPATVIATQDVVAMRVSRDVFLRVAGEFPDFGLRVRERIAERLELSLADLNRVRQLFEEAQSSDRKVKRSQDGNMV